MFHLLWVTLQWLEIPCCSTDSLNVYRSTLTLKENARISVEDRRHSVCRNNTKIPTLASSHCKTHSVWWSVHIIVTAAINHKFYNCLEGRFPVNLKPKIKVGHIVLASLLSIDKFLVILLCKEHTYHLSWAFMKCYYCGIYTVNETEIVSAFPFLYFHVNTSLSNLCYF